MKVKNHNNNQQINLKLNMKLANHFNNLISSQQKQNPKTIFCSSYLLTNPNAESLNTSLSYIQVNNIPLIHTYDDSFYMTCNDYSTYEMLVNLSYPQLSYVNIAYKLNSSIMYHMKTRFIVINLKQDERVIRVSFSPAFSL